MSGPLIKCFGIHAAFLEETRGSVLLGGWRWSDGGTGEYLFPITSSLLSQKSHRYRHTYETWMAVGNGNPLVLAVIKRAETARTAVAEDFVPLQLDSAEDPVIRRREIAARDIAGLHPCDHESRCL